MYSIPAVVRSTVLPSLLFLSLAGAAGTSSSASAQNADQLLPGSEDQIVNILQEPRHRIVHHEGDVWVLDIQINPGDSTKQHTHDSAVLYNFISSGSGSSNGRLTSNTDYVTENYTHRAANEGPGLFRIIAVANYGQPHEDVTADRPSGLQGQPEIENPWFRAYRITLAPGQKTPILLHSSPAVIVQVTDGLAHVSRQDGITAELTGQGSWAWRDADSGYQITNMSSAPIELNITEPR